MAAAAPSPYRSSPLYSDPSKAAPASNSPAHAVSKKQQDRDAGRRRLEEFRKKKRAQKPSSGPSVDESVPDAPPSERQLAAGGTSGTPSTSAASNGHISKDSRQDGADTSSGESPATAEVAVVSVPIRQLVGEIVSSTSDTCLHEAEQGVESKVFLSGVGIKDVNTARGALEHDPLQPNISLSGPLSGRVETSGGFNVSVPTSAANTDITSRNRFGKSTAPVGASGPIVVPAPTTVTKFVPSYIEAPIAGNGGQGKGVRPSSFSPSFTAIQPLSSVSLPTPIGGSLVHTNDRLFSNRGQREEANPPNSMEPEQEMVSSAMSVRFAASVPPDGTRLNAGASAPFPTDNESWRMPNSGMDKRSVSPVVNSVFSTVHLPSRISESFAPVVSAGPVHLPLPPPRSHPPWVSSFSHSSSSEPSLPTSLGNGSDIIPPELVSTSSSGASDSPAPRSPELPDPRFSEDNSSAYTVYENGILEPTTRPLSWSSTFALGPSDQIKKPWQLPPAKSATDDFAMLEQHIEDLTQEKFSLQRGLDAARALAETLAQENSALTEDYNNQGALVNELKEEIERLKGEIRAQAVVVKNVSSEKAKALQECKSAVGRAQALAAEVIALEEKVLKSRSQELKLQREMESLAADTESQRRQLASLDKDRGNLRSLVEALQEEKTLLQTRLRKAVSVEDVRSTPNDAPASSATTSIVKIDISTSTEDLELAGTAVIPSSSQLALEQAQITGFPSLDQQYGQPAIMPSVQTIPILSNIQLGQSSESSSSIMTRSPLLLHSTSSLGTRLGGRSLHLSPGSAIIPEDQVAIVENINTLVSELAEEKEALLKALKAESVGASELRALNAELSHKLEVQTQRLELAVAQNMARGSTPALEKPFETSRLGPVYVDEGDEVVDRVLGWIMQLFPSGSSRRKRL